MLDYIARGSILKQFKNKVCQINSKHFRWEGERLVEMICVPLHSGMPGSHSLWATHREWLQCSQPRCGLSWGLHFSFSSSEITKPVVWELQTGETHWGNALAADSASYAGRHTNFLTPASGPGSEALPLNYRFVDH